MGSPKLLRAMFGPVAEVEKEGELPKIYAKEEVPFRYSKTGGDSVMQRLTSRPAIIPDVDAWAIGTVCKGRSFNSRKRLKGQAQKKPNNEKRGSQWRFLRYGTSESGISALQAR